jgi:hypothetical protein
MAFDRSKDKEIRSWAIGDPDDKHLRVSVMQYNDGEMKLQIGPRVYIRRDGREGFGKAGRLTLNEVKALTDLAPEIEGILSGNAIPV